MYKPTFGNLIVKVGIQQTQFRALTRFCGAVHCPYYMKTGACKYGATCKFDHPPPGEVMVMATSTSVGGEGNQNETVEQQQ
ncbi:floral homeotic protein [Actinidia rufa]|uniref:Floral homeotic protein n=1 Tax=Actinidia rufa TaxID=165716 RepID=A0A7J0FKR4_9ERIC|nr:floral homeotic protein [Actinidia rufa]